MKLLADESFDGPIVIALRTEGWSVKAVWEMAPGLSDEEVLALAIGSDSVLLTADKDFGELVFRQRRVHGGVVLIRLEGLVEQAKIALVVSAGSSHNCATRTDGTGACWGKYVH